MQLQVKNMLENKDTDQNMWLPDRLSISNMYLQRNDLCPTYKVGLECT